MVNGWLYDQAGNLLQVGGMTRNFAYDAENRMVQATINTDVDQYTYDGEGRRVSKTTPYGGGSTTVYLYDAFGQLAAEYGPVSETGTKFLTVDALGSTRLITPLSPVAGASGNAVNYDYLPFGQELCAGTGGRDATFGCGVYPSAPGGTAQKFTGKERDAETGWDYFGARYMSSAQGRFTSGDPRSAGAELQNPQSWNGYTYALNNSLRYIDHNGKWPTDIHNAILNSAFNRLSSSQLDILRGASLAVDSFTAGGQTAELAFQHGMRGPFENPEKARAKADGFIFSNEEVAKAEFVKVGSIDDTALKAFGTAMHTVMDRTSPAHAGEQLWTGGGEPGITGIGGPPGVLIGAGIDGARAIAHSRGEKQITLGQYHQTIDSVRTEYLKTFGQDAFQRATGCRQVQGCAYDDSQLPNKPRK